MSAAIQATTVDLVLPALGDGVTEATVAHWLVSPGDAVTAGEPVLEVSTDKVDTEIESPYDGVVAEIIADTGSTVAIGGLLARITPAGGEAYAPEPERPGRLGVPGGHRLDR
jgi:pyruvate/2-oxoglutarate dehydrogenase complex dihydrolipoamide acyltransferase (E2) component